MSGDFDFPIPVGNPEFWHRTYAVGDVSKSVPAFTPAYLPLPSMGVTIATLDIGGNLTIKVDQPSEPKSSRTDLNNLLRIIGSGQKIDAIRQYRAMVVATLKDSKDAIELAMPPIRDAPEGT